MERSCLHCNAKEKDGNVMICVINRKEGAPPKFRLNRIQKRWFPRRIALCYKCIPSELRYVKCDTCGDTMLDDWYTGESKEGIVFHCRCCLTDAIISERFEYTLGVKISGLKWWNAWKEPSGIFRKNLFNEIFRKATKMICHPPVDQRNVSSQLSDDSRHDEQVST